MLPVHRKRCSEGNCVKDLGGDCFIFRDVCGFPKFFAEFFAGFKPLDQVKPVFCEPEHCISGASEGNKVLLKKCVVKGLQCGNGRTTGCQHTGIADKPSPKHQAG